MEDQECAVDIPTLSEADGIRYLHFGSRWIQGAMHLSRPYELVLEYTAQMMGWLLFLDPPREKLIGLLGLGAGSLARFCLKHTKSSIVAVEWNPQVITLCEHSFRLKASARLKVEQNDAARWVELIENKGCVSVLMVDLYDTASVGPVRDSVDFYQGCRRILDKVGLLVVNLFNDPTGFNRNIKNISQVFENRLVMLPATSAGNCIVIAFAGPPLIITPRALSIRAEFVQTHYGLPATYWARKLSSHTHDGLLYF